MRALIAKLLAAALAALTSACDDGPATMAGGTASPATWSSFVYAAKAGPVLVRIVGNPFAAPAEDTDSAIIKAINNALTAPVARFTTDPAEAPSPDIRIILAFNPPVTLSGAKLCASGTLPPMGPPAAKVSILAAFCAGTERLSEVEGWAKADGPQAPRFTALIGQVARDLIARHRN